MSAPDRARVYRNIELRQRWLGLDPLDLFGVGGLAWLLNVMSSGTVGWNLLLVAAAAVVLRLWKRVTPVKREGEDKPSGSASAWRSRTSTTKASGRPSACA